MGIRSACVRQASWLVQDSILFFLLPLCLHARREQTPRAAKVKSIGMWDKKIKVFSPLSCREQPMTTPSDPANPASNIRSLVSVQSARLLSSPVSSHRLINNCIRPSSPTICQRHCQIFCSIKSCLRAMPWPAGASNGLYRKYLIKYAPYSRNPSHILHLAVLGCP